MNRSGDLHPLKPDSMLLKGKLLRRHVGISRHQDHHISRLLGKDLHELHSERHIEFFLLVELDPIPLEGAELELVMRYLARVIDVFVVSQRGEGMDLSDLLAPRSSNLVEERIRERVKAEPAGWLVTMQSIFDQVLDRVKEVEPV